MQSTIENELDLTTMIQKYNSVTERLKRSHETLGHEVCRLREELNRKNKELHRRERLAALGEMAAGVAHEIRNPLGGIRLYASLLERDLKDRPEQLDMVKKLEAGVRNLDRVVGDILTFAGDAESNFQVIQLSEILESVYAQTAHKATEHQINLDFDPAADSIELYCDQVQIERALINLVHNAIEAAPDNGHVWVKNSQDQEELTFGNGFCHVSVEDDGSGIDPQLMQRVFNPFFTTKHTGTGLGLAIVHRIAEANGGRVTVGQSTNGGAAFILSVPLTDIRQQAADAGGIE